MAIGALEQLKTETIGPLKQLELLVELLPVKQLQLELLVELLPVLLHLEFVQGIYFANILFAGHLTLSNLLFIAPVPMSSLSSALLFVTSNSCFFCNISNNLDNTIYRQRPSLHLVMPPYHNSLGLITYNQREPN